MRFCFVIIFSILLSVFITGCQKEFEPFGSSQTNPVDSTSNSTASYYPLTTDTWWKYKDSVTGDITTNTVTSATKTINGLVYKAVISASSQQTDTGWAASPRPNYYLTKQGIGPSGASYDLNFNYLNDTASVGYHWQYDAGSGGGFTALGTTTIIAKNLTLTVAGKTYTNVIQTRFDLSYNLFGSQMDAGRYDFFVAKGIGVVKVESKIDFGGVAVETSSDLVDYSIK